MSTPEKRRTTLFILLCCLCLFMVVAYGWFHARRQTLPERRVPSTVSQSTPPVRPPEAALPPPQAATTKQERVSPAPLRAVPKVPAQRNKTQKTATVARVAPENSAEAESPWLYFRTNALGQNYGKLTVAPLKALDQPHYAKDLLCERVHYNSGAGVCLVADRGLFTKYYAVTFDSQLRPIHTLPLGGEPSRVRVSPSGHLAAITVFVSGHSYASLSFSTQTTIIDVGSGRTLCDLEQFSVSRDNAPFRSADFNFWGVTFKRDENQFYATLWSSRRTYLIQADLSKRTAQVLREGVECPSLSPDNTRIAFKKRLGDRQINWKISLLDLKTLTEAELGETRNVDDQVEWLDNDHILYALSENETGSSASTDIWELPAHPGGPPQLLLKGAYSPAVVYSNWLSNQPHNQSEPSDSKSVTR